MRPAGKELADDFPDEVRQRLRQQRQQQEEDAPEDDFRPLFLQREKEGHNALPEFSHSCTP